MSFIKDDHSEGKVTKAIEKQTSKIPSDVFLWAALGSMAVSAGLKAAGRGRSALFVGQWAAPFLLLGVYNKIVKTEGSDAKSAPGSDDIDWESDHPFTGFAEPDEQEIFS